ncbi:MAG: AlkA N-terminal domain-containing protein [Mycobacteriales bacterium]|nr:MAG: AraC family transcriptional regulator [Pseudonocardiales bacterium]
MIEDFDQCYRAVRSRDRRFDGRFVTAVRTTGIYCRPSCPAQTPKRENVRFYAVAAAAQAAGFRACKRCRPQAAPGSRDWDARSDIAGRALRLIASGIADSDGVHGLATRLAVSERHLHRLLLAEVGAGPLALARTRRAQTARLLVESTSMQLSDIAFCAGYSSIRQFNDSIRQAFGTTPTALRTRRRRDDVPGTGAVVVRLAFRPPYDAVSLLNWLRARAIRGLEEVTTTTYRRSIQLPHTTGTMDLEPGEDHMVMRLVIDDMRDVAVAVASCRQLADLDADPNAVDDALAADAMLRRLVAARPGLRVPGSIDGFELACRAVLGQQVTVGGARTLAARLVEKLGKPLDRPTSVVTHHFPAAQTIADADLSDIGLTRARIKTLRALATAVADDGLSLDRGADRAATERALLALPGFGPWTASYVAMRALGDPDAFPASDLGLLRASKALGGPDDAAGLAEYSLRWRPWRSYAAQHLWTHPTTKGSR